MSEQKTRKNAIGNEFCHFCGREYLHDKALITLSKKELAYRLAQIAYIATRSSNKIYLAEKITTLLYPDGRLGLTPNDGGRFVDLLLKKVKNK